MARFGILALLLCTYLVSAGCATKLDMALISRPEGAALVAHRPLVGSEADYDMGMRLPWVGKWTLHGEDLARWKRNECVNYFDVFNITETQIVARWPSGAERAIPVSELEICRRDGKGRAFVWTRPSDAPDLSTDLLYEVEVRRLRALQGQESGRSATEILRDLLIIRALTPPSE